MSADCENPQNVNKVKTRMSGSGKGLLGLWLYRSGEQEWAVKEGSPLHNQDDLVVNRYFFCHGLN